MPLLPDKYICGFGVNYVYNLAKAQAKKAGVPYTSFMVGIIENAMAKPARRLT